MVSLTWQLARRAAVLAVFVAFLIPAPGNSAPFAALVMDARSGEVLYEKNADARLHPASLTKMMTLYIAFQEIQAGRLSLDQTVTISRHAAAQPPSKLGLKPGQKIKLRHLIRAAAIKSANDAATAIGEAVAGSESAFAERMTRTARALGMKSTTYRNANGLTASGHLSSARDMTLMGRHLFYDFPQYYNLFSRRSEDAGIARVYNTNRRFLDAYKGADGIKTGYTAAAGYNLTASAQRGNKRIIATLLGGTSTPARNAKMAELLDIGFRRARNNVRERRPAAAPALVAAATPVGAAKTLRVSGAVSRSLRPHARPPVASPEMPDAIALAIAESVQDAMTPATQQQDDRTEAAVELALAASTVPLPARKPAPEADTAADTNEAGAIEDAVDVASAAAVTDVVETVAVDEPVVAPEPRPASAAPPAPPGTFEAQAMALVDAGAADEIMVDDAVALATLDAQAAALGEEAADAPSASALAASLRPAHRPDAPSRATDAALAESTSAAEDERHARAGDASLFEQAENAGMPLIELAAVDEATAPDAETPSPELAALSTGSRHAPIYADAPATARAAEDDDLVVITKATSGNRHWGVNVGGYASRYEAERALLKTGLAENATLSSGLRKITQDGGKYRASFLGLGADQADLACRRLRARGVACETIGPS